MPTKTLLICLLSLLAVGALALGAAACGGSDDEGDGGGGSNGADAADTADAGGEGSGDGGDGAADGDGDGDGNLNKAGAKATVEALYAAMREMDAEGVCDQLNQAAQDQIAKGGLAGEKTGSCVEGFESFFDQAREAGGMEAPFEAEVRKVAIKGKRATVTVNFGPERNGDIPLVEVDGEWKLEAVGAAPSQ